MPGAQGRKAHRKRTIRTKRTKQTEQALHHAASQPGASCWRNFRGRKFVITCELMSNLVGAALKQARLIFILAGLAVARGAEYPAQVEADYTIRDFKFSSGESLPELRIHYRTLGKAEKDAA